VLTFGIPFVGTEFPPLEQWPFILFAAVLAILSMLLLSWAYARAEASYLASTEYTAFLWASLFGWLVFDEHVSLFTFAGACMIVAGCILAARRPQEASPTLEAAT
jgi:S-adenosylmethionine uptake transporter